jgi:hypothetical protein
MPEREKFSLQMDEQLKHVKSRIDDAKAKAEARGQDFLQHYEQDLARLESKYDLTRYKLSLLRKGGQSAWVELREGCERAFHDLKEALSRALDKF